MTDERCQRIPPTTDLHFGFILETTYSDLFLKAIGRESFLLLLKNALVTIEHY